MNSRKANLAINDPATAGYGGSDLIGPDRHHKDTMQVYGLTLAQVRERVRASRIDQGLPVALPQEQIEQIASLVRHHDQTAQAAS